ncbi:MAG TPA: signal recognition particle protein [Pirellulaceae bacterium]|nr:signal recognition particle protein [Pirellulaceae bacterium]
MFESLQTGLQSAWKSLRGKGKLTEGNMRDGLAIVEQSLLEADVSYSVVQTFMAKVSEKALGQKVMLALDPGQQLIGVVRDELISLLGPVDSSLHLKQETTVIMLCGLQGSGKTTTVAKLARLLLDNKVKSMLVAADLQRPAAIEQLHVNGEKLGVPVYSEPGAKDPVLVCQNAVKQAKATNTRVVILDTAGRLAIDRELMDELKRIDARVQPDQVYLVVDGMTGQDAVNSAKAFNEALELNGVIMTKLDGDARGGALLSVKDVTGVPIKFIGTGEHLDSLEPFRPEGMAGRILGLGDTLALVDEVRKIVDEDEREKWEQKAKEGEFTLDDFKVQMEKIAKPGLMQKMLGLLPGAGQLQEMLAGTDSAKEARRFIGMVNAMTPQERRNPKVIDPSRRSRIAKGAGVQPQEVSALVKQYDTMKQMVTGLAGANMRDRMSMFNQLKDNAISNPGALMSKSKVGTGKRLTTEEKNRLRKQREKDLKKRKKGDK